MKRALASALVLAVLAAAPLAATTVLYTSVSRSVQLSDLILLGHVLRLENGYNQDGEIVTKVHLLVEESLKGAALRGQVFVFDAWGGSMDGTYVETVYEPVSAAQDDLGRVWLEVHPDVYRGRRADPARIRAKLVAAGLGDVVDWERVDEVVKRQWGTAEDVTRRDAPLRLIIEPTPELVEASLPARFVLIGTP